MCRASKELGSGVGRVSGKVSPDRRRNARVGVCEAESWHPPRAMKENATTGEPQTVSWVVVQVSGQRGRLEARAGRIVCAKPSPENSRRFQRR